MVETDLCHWANHVLIQSSHPWTSRLRPNQSTTSSVSTRKSVMSLPAFMIGTSQHETVVFVFFISQLGPDSAFIFILSHNLNYCRLWASSSGFLCGILGGGRSGFTLSAQIQVSSFTNSFKYDNQTIMADFAPSPSDDIRRVIDWDSPIGSTIHKQLHEK